MGETILLEEFLGHGEGGSQGAWMRMTWVNALGKGGGAGMGLGVGGFAPEASSPHMPGLHSGQGWGWGGGPHVLLISVGSHGYVFSRYTSGPLCLSFHRLVSLQWHLA